MKKYKSFSEQGRECNKNGNSFVVKAPYSKQTIIVCVKYKTYCHSKACIEERTGLTKAELNSIARKNLKILNRILKKCIPDHRL